MVFEVKEKKESNTSYTQWVAKLKRKQEAALKKELEDRKRINALYDMMSYEQRKAVDIAAFVMIQALSVEQRKKIDKINLLRSCVNYDVKG